MGDSQSRYSIVERLTERKLNIIQAKSELDESIKRKENEVSESELTLKDFKETSYREIEAKEREMEREITRAKSRLTLAKEQKAQKEKAYDAQLKAVEEALVKIEEVSKAAGQ